MERSDGTSGGAAKLDGSTAAPSVPAKPPRSLSAHTHTPAAQLQLAGTAQKRGGGVQIQVEKEHL